MEWSFISFFTCERAPSLRLSHCLMYRHTLLGSQCQANLGLLWLSHSRCLKHRHLDLVRTIYSSVLQNIQTVCSLLYKFLSYSFIDHCQLHVLCGSCFKENKLKYRRCAKKTMYLHFCWFLFFYIISKHTSCPLHCV